MRLGMGEPCLNKYGAIEKEISECMGSFGFSLAHRAEVVHRCRIVIFVRLIMHV